MPESGLVIDAAVLRARLPDRWRVAGSGAGVYGHTDGADDDRTIELSNPGNASAHFSIRPDGGLWTATWKASQEFGADPRAASDKVTGAKERCIEWVIERARYAEEQRRE